MKYVNTMSWFYSCSPSTTCHYLIPHDHMSNWNARSMPRYCADTNVPPVAAAHLGLEGSSVIGFVFPWEVPL